MVATQRAGVAVTVLSMAFGMTAAAGLVAPQDKPALAPLTPQQIQEAIAHGQKAKDVSLIPVAIDSKWAMGGGPYIGWASGPWLRVAKASFAAKRKYQPYTAENVDPEDVAPELHVYILSRVSDGAKSAIDRVDVEAIVITRRRARMTRSVPRPFSQRS